jgi:N-formylglutamate amidohydrolase
VFNGSKTAADPRMVRITRTEASSEWRELMKKMIAVAALGLTTMSSGAHAGGWIADNIIKPIAGKHAAREADKVHEQLGKPGDKVVDAAKAAAAAAGTAVILGDSK